MVAKDTLIGIVGAIILVAALTGVFYYEGSQANGAAGSQAYDVAWSSRTVNGPGADGYLEEGNSEDVELNITTRNLTTATFVLEWTDDTGDPDRFRVTVTSPDGAFTNTSEGNSGRITVTIPGVNSVPPETTIYANTMDGAREKAADKYTATRGVGTWVVTVELVNAGDFNPAGTGPPVQEDEGNTWELTSELEAYQPNLELS